MSRTYTAVGSIRAEATTPTLRNLLFDLGFQATHDAEVSGVFDVAGDTALDLARVQNVKVLLIRVLSGGPLVAKVSSGAGAEQLIPLDDLLFMNLSGSDSITAVTLTGAARIEFLAAGGA